MEEQSQKRDPKEPIRLQTVADQLLARLTQSQKTTSKSIGRFYIPEADKVFTQFYSAVVERRGRHYEKNDDLEQRLARIGRWISDPGAPSGLLLGGRPGNGKTTAIRALQLLISCSGQKDPVNLDHYGHPDDAVMKVVNAFDLASICEQKDGQFDRLKKMGILAIDDIGIEPLDYSKFGNIVNPLIDIFYYRYEKQLMTVFSTNLTTEMLDKRYGDRFADRLNEMAYRVGFPSHSFRYNNYE